MNKKIKVQNMPVSEVSFITPRQKEQKLIKLFLAARRLQLTDFIKANASMVCDEAVTECVADKVWREQE